MLKAGRKVAMLVGIGARDARAEVLAVAEALASPIVKTLPGKQVVPDEHPLTTGGLGLLGTAPSEELMEECDTLLMVGTSFPYGKYLPAPGQAKVVQIEVDPSLLGMRLPVDAPVCADARLALRELLPLLTHHPDRSFLEKYQRKMDAWRSDMTRLVDPERVPVAPQYLIGCIDAAAADDAILTCDSGTIATWSARHWTIRGDREFYLSGNLATMAPGLPYAIAMQHAYPGRQVIAYVGDGGFAMLMAEFLTAVRHELPIKVVINNNNSYGQILWEQIILGYPEYAVRHRQPEADFSSWARGCGAFAIKVTDPKARAGCHPGRPRASRPGAGGLRRQPERAADARQGQVRPGEELHRGVPARPAAQGRHAGLRRPRQDQRVAVMTEVLPETVLRPPEPAHDIDLAALAAELRAKVDGEVRFDVGSRAAYSTDGSNYRQVPLGVVVPRTVEAAVAAVAVCRRHGAPLTSRGGGTSLAGECTNTAVILDWSKYCHRLLEVDADRPGPASSSPASSSTS